MLAPPFASVGTGVGGSTAIQVKVDFRNIYRSFKTLERKMGQMRVPLKQAAVDYMTKKVIKQRFQQSKGVVRWKQHSSETIKRHGSHMLLILSGKLKESATGGSGFFINYHTYRGVHSAHFGSSLDYAVAHDQPRGTYFDTGKSQIPGRPWSNVTQENANKMRDIFMKWTQKKMNESGFRRM